MKTLATHVLALAALIVMLSSCTPRVRPQIAVLADSIAHSGAVDNELIGMMPNTQLSPQFLRFVHLADSATSGELVEIAQDTSRALRYYSLLALSHRDDPSVLPCLRSHLSDSAIVRRLTFDMLGYKPISSFVADEFLERYFAKTSQRKLNYSDVRGLASDSRVPSALVALARFHNPRDIEFLRNQIRHYLFLIPVLPNNASPYYPYYGLAAIRDFPDSTFYPLLAESVDSLIVGRAIPQDVLIQAIFQYQSESAVALLQRVINNSVRHSHDTFRSQVDLAMALLKYPVRFYQYRFAKQIKLDFNTIIIWHKWTADKL